MPHYDAIVLISRYFCLIGLNCFVYLVDTLPKDERQVSSRQLFRLQYRYITYLNVLVVETWVCPGGGWKTVTNLLFAST